MQANIDNIIENAKNGDIEAINSIIKIYFSLISTNAKKYFITGGEYDDLVQEGMVGLLKAIKYFDSTKSSFTNFALLCIKRQIFSAIKSANSQKNIFLNEAISNNFEDKKNLDKLTTFSLNPEENILTKEKIENLKKYFDSNLSKFEREVFKFIIKDYSYKEIANKLNKDIKSVDNAIQRIKKKSEIWLKNYEF